ncbi:hypothetical protein [Stackebrandtia nassauensis]|uniref:hypothetical protein n=1 Tax=Stackebrandtia nassauensis TaxID=283811 RepID=UPI00118680F9|nr:hypothetical protein [Stackebrandtia nassauensis]
MRGMARKFSNSPGRASRFASRVVATARFVVGAFAILVLAVPVTMDDDAAPPMRLVDDGGGDGSSSDPPYTPSPSGESPSPSDGPSGNDGENGKKPPPAEEAAAGIPVAAQAGISLGVIGLAALALLPGRRPPAHLR